VNYRIDDLRPATTTSTTADMSSQRESLLPFSQYGDVMANRGGGLFSCCSDMSICCLGYWCPCYLFGRTAQRAGVSSSTLCGCLTYLMVFAAMTVVGLVAMLDYMSRLSDYVDCENAVPHPSHEGSGDGSSNDDLTAYVGAPDDDHCQDLLWKAIRTYLAHTVAIQVVCMVLFGALLGYYRQKITVALGDTGSGFKSFMLHCLPCTNACALCQEARAVETLSKGVPYGGLQQSTSTEAKLSF